MKTPLYLLDTNVLLADPDALYGYPEADLAIPLSVLEGIDRFKREFNERGRNARLVSLMLDGLRKEGSLTEGIRLKNGALLRVLLEVPPAEGRSGVKSQVLATALACQAQRPVTLVSNDINLRVRASALGLEANSHEEKTKHPQEIYEAIHERILTPEEATALGSELQFPAEPRHYPNQNLILVQGAEKTLLRLHEGKSHFKRCPGFAQGIWGLHPRNLEQTAALDLLMDESVPLVTLAGKAGTGKTLLALAAALELMLKVGSYQKILVSRPIFPMGRDMGYLPGDIDEKMAPWMQPIFDNLEFLFAHKPNMGSFERLREKGLIELEPLTYIRGRSIPGRIMIVDEAQNLTPHEIKTIVTRVGENTKLIFTGDPYQIDNPYIDPNTNGLSYIIQRFQRHAMAGHVTLVNGVRSPLAELASNIL